MINSISSLQSLNNSQRPNMFNRIDANKDGAVTKEEFVSARPKNVSDTKAAELFSKIDTEQTGRVNQAQFEAGLEKNKPQKPSQGLENLLGSAVMSALMQLNQQSAPNQASQNDEMLAKVDTDGDGSITKQEFVDARPDDVSEEQASNLFAKLDSENKGTLSQSEFETAMQSNEPKGKGGPPPSGGGKDASSSSQSDESQNYDKLDTNKDGKVSVSELLAGIEENSNQSNDDGAKALLSAISDAIKSYGANNDVNFDNTILFESAA